MTKGVRRKDARLIYLAYYTLFSVNYRILPNLSVLITNEYHITFFDNNLLVLRQYRTEIVPQLRSRFFCQIVSEYRRNTDVFQGIMVQADGKRSSRCGAEP